jgi:flagellin
MRINTNVNALNTLRNLANTENAVASSTAKLSSGFRINKASDDSAGLAIANKLRNTGAALTQASQNADQASSMLQVADGAAQTIAQIVDRMKQLASAAATDNVGTGSDDQRDKLQTEFTALNDEIGRIVDTTKYQGVALLGGGSSVGGATVDSSSVTAAADIASISAGNTAATGTYTLSSAAGTAGVVTLDDGAGHSQSLIAVNGEQTLSFDKLGVTVKTGVGFVASQADDTTDAASFDTASFGVTAGTSSGASLNFLIGASGDPAGEDTLTLSLGSIAKLGTDDITSTTAAHTAMANVDTLLNDVNTYLGKLGASESRISFAQQNLASTIQNTAAAESTIRDVDMASEMANFSKSNILAQAGTAMLAQANQSGQGVLRLFK